MPTRLEKTLYRLEAQNKCFTWCFQEITNLDGCVFELGLGLGRTWNHLNHYLSDRDIYVFDRQVGSYPDCTPPEDRLYIGEISETLPRAAIEHRGQVVLAHADLGSFDKESNKAVSAMLSSLLEPALAPGALIMGDLPLEVPNTIQLALPEGAREDRYYLYRYKL